MENTRTNKETIISEIINYFEENTELFNETIEELDGYNGYLGDDRYFDMYELDELFRDSDPTELLNRAFFGYDEDFTDKEGNHSEPFNPNKEYFRFNVYGNLVSAYWKDYSDKLDDYFVESLSDNRSNLYIEDAELNELLDRLEEEA